MIHVVELDRAVPQPWRNGGGQTRELLAWPPGATPGHWQLRVSVADVDQDGPFSPFPHVQRWFAVLEGHGVALRFGERELTLMPGRAPISFDGAEAPGCRLLGHPTRDLNLMVRHEAGKASMRVAGDGDALGGEARWRGVYAASPLTLLPEDGGRVPLPAASLAWCDEPRGPWRLEPATGSTLQAWWLQLDAPA